ncbi:MAG: protein kinase, partial [Gammaproteobacteria bacterium]|nr:protein kinase [Gammaproteobacteria bacterium]
MSISGSGRSRFKSLTGLVLLTGICLALFSVRLSWLDWADSKMFGLATTLLPTPEQVSSIELIDIPETVTTDPEQVSQLVWLVNKVSKSNAAAIGLFLDQLPSLDYEQSGSKNTQWQFSKSSLSLLAKTLQSKQVRVGVPVSTLTDYYSVGTLSSDDSDEEDMRNRLRKLLMPVPGLVSVHSVDSNFPYQRLPFKSVNVTARQPLIWHEPDSGITLPDFSSGLYAQFKKTRKLSWDNSGAIQVKSNQIKTDISGHVMMYFSSYTGNNYERSFIPVEDALKATHKQFKNKIVLIGQADNPAVLLIANNLASLISQSFYYTPEWGYWLNIALLFVVLFYLIKIVPDIGRTTAYVISLLLLFVILVCQFGVLVIKGLWMPLIPVYVYLVIGHIIILFKQQSDAEFNHIQLQAHEALWHLGQNQFEKGEHEKAMSSLLKCMPTADVLEKMYEIGLGFERRREYEKAIQLYSEINLRHKGFKDINKRLGSLSNVTGTATEILTPGSASKTLVMPDLGLQLPVLGRYELEKELGRGAMGVVYLGKDPKINRQVAIKTLDYNMFTESEIKTIKSRFFREAEAAGRLSHPNIVTVYDVGDEKDFAFIAMDYAKGVPLSDYTEKKKLLPVAE